MNNSNLKTVPVVVKERKHLGAKQYVTGACIDGFAGPKVKEHGGLQRIKIAYDTSEVIKYYFDGTVLTVDLKK